MKIKDGFVLRRLPDLNMVMPAGENIQSFHAALILNDTAALIFDGLKAGLDRQAILERMTAVYKVDEKKALSGIDKTFALLVEGGVAE